MHLSQITPSIFASLGLSTAEDFLRVGLSPFGRELLFLIDGFGADVLGNYGDAIPHLSMLRNFTNIQTSFPTTTATSLATLTTGELPGVHGMLGYTVQVPRSGGRILNALKWDERVDPQIWQPVPTLFERAMKELISVTHVAASSYENTGFTRAVFRGAKYRGANTALDLISESVAALQNTPSFVYLYVNDLDKAGHSDGVGSDKWLAALQAIDAVFGQLLKELPRGTRVWVTSDHGMINVEKKIIIGQGNSLLRGVKVIAGEPRARHLYLDNESASARADVAELWREFLREDAQIITREEAIKSELFGPNPTLDAIERMGDVIAIARGGVVLLDPDRVKKEGAMIGHHGGDSLIESSVSLLTTTLS